MQACVRAGKPAWDEPSARYAVEIGRAHARASLPFGRRGEVWVFPILAAFSWLNVAIQWSDGLSVDTETYGWAW